MASRRIFGIAEGILAREKAEAVVEVADAETAQWFVAARQAEGVSV